MNSKAFPIAFLTLAVVASACSDNTPISPTPINPVPPSIRSIASSEILASVSGRQERGAEDEILRLEAAIPGFGGLFLSPEGKVVIYVPANANLAQVRGILAREAAKTRLGSVVRNALGSGQGLEIRVADYPFSQLIGWQKMLSPHLNRVSGVISIDADESKNRVRVSISSQEVAGVVAQAAEAAGIPAGAVLTEIRLPVIMSSGLRGTWRPTGGGVQVSSQNGDGGRCSLGYNVTTPTGAMGFLTAAHCDYDTPGNGTLGGVMYQPTLNLGIGTVTINPAFNFSDPECRGNPCTRADVMFVRYDLASQALKRVAYTDFTGFNNQGGSITVTGWWTNIDNAADVPPIGARVDKVGRTTGWTAGTLGATCENPLIGVGNVVNYTPYVVLCAGRVDNARWGTGDSGSPVFIAPAPGQVTDPLVRHGILFAGSGVVNQDTQDLTTYCYSQCSYFYSQWWQIEAHLGMPVGAASG